MTPLTHSLFRIGTSLVAQMVKHLSTMRETRVQSLGWEDPLEKEMATRSSVLVWKILWTEEPGRLQSLVLQSVRYEGKHTRTHTSFSSVQSLSCVRLFATP